MISTKGMYGVAIIARSKKEFMVTERLVDCGNGTATFSLLVLEVFAKHMTCKTL